MSIEDIFSKLAKSKAALDALKAFQTYQELIAQGWPSDKAFLVAFMGIQIFFSPEIKPIPKPCPYFKASSLYEVVKEAYTDVSNLKLHIEKGLKYLKDYMEKEDI